MSGKEQDNRQRKERSEIKLFSSKWAVGLGELRHIYNMYIFLTSHKTLEEQQFGSQMMALKRAMSRKTARKLPAIGCRRFRIREIHKKRILN